MVARRTGVGISMAGGGEKSGDLYAVLGLNRECSDVELRNAYKKLALRWHPDRCSASGNSKMVAEAKEKFQEIQEAYSVLSDMNERFLYDVGLCDPDDDGNGMGDFLGEMAEMMRQSNEEEKGQESFEDLQRLFVDMFQADLHAGFGGGFQTPPSSVQDRAKSTPFGGSHKRGSAAMARKGKLGDVGSGGFCFGSNDRGGSSSRRRDGRKQKVSSSRRDTGIST